MMIQKMRCDEIFKKENSTAEYHTVLSWMEHNKQIVEYISGTKTVNHS